jgi:predicted oxidoreductase
MTQVSRITAGGEEFTMSRVAAGMWRLPLDATQTTIGNFISQCTNAGITTFDHADIYGDYGVEALFGKAIKGKSSLRRKIELVTKFGIRLISQKRPDHQVKSYDTSREHIITSVENSLKNLCTDHIDLLLIHRPDFLMDADEVAETFWKLKESGKVRYFGVSNHTVAQVELLQSRFPYSLAANQIEFSVLHTDPLSDGVLDQCQRLGIVPMAWSPFGGGRLFTATEGPAIRVQKALQQFVQQAGSGTIAQAALSWLLKHPARVQPIIGTYKPERIQEMAEAEKLMMSREQWYAIWQAAMGHEVP